MNPDTPSRRSSGRGLFIALPCLAALLLPCIGLAQSATSNLPINIEADSAEYSQRTGVSVYRGEVVLEQGGLELRGRQLTISRNDADGAIKAVLQGAPATLRKPPDKNSESLVTGHAESMEYQSAEAVIVLRGDAVVERGGDVIRSDVIRHHINSARTDAEGTPDGGRVRITIQPETARGADLPGKQSGESANQP